MNPRYTALLVWFVGSLVFWNILYTVFCTDIVKRIWEETDPKAKKKPRKLRGLSGKGRGRSAAFVVLAILVTWIGWMAIDSRYLPIRGRGVVGYPVAWMRYYTNGKFPPPFAGEEETYEGTAYERRMRFVQEEMGE